MAAPTDSSDSAPDTPRGSLSVLLGAAPGVGKTWAMLAEAHRLRADGTDVVVGVAETHGRAGTAAQLDGLEVVPRRVVEHRGVELAELDVGAVLARAPEVVLVDELAHTNAPGSRFPKRWQDVAALRDAGIDVITTLNVQHLASLTDVVEAITGARQQETVPDAIVREADDIRLVDLEPEALRRRLARGEIYAAERVDAALRAWFRPGNLAALRELALLWVADRVETGLADYRRRHGIAETWATRDRVLVAISGGEEGGTLIRRGARLLGRAGGSLGVVHVLADDGLARSEPATLRRHQRLTEELAGTFTILSGDDPARAVLDHARASQTSQIVVGLSRRRSWWPWRASVGQRIIEGSGDIDVHVVTHERVGRRAAARGGRLARWRRLLGMVLALVLPSAFAAIMLRVNFPGDDTVASLGFLAATVAVALVGGVWPAALAAGVAFLLMNWFFVEPTLTLSVATPGGVLSLAMLTVVGLSVAVVVDTSARRARRAAEARAEADALLALTSATLRRGTPESALAEVARMFGQRSVTLRTRASPASAWRVVAGVGHHNGDSAGTELTLDEQHAFVLTGPALSAAQTRVVTAFGTQLLGALERRELAATAARAGDLEARNALQGSLLAAVSHDLRTPLAAIKASASGLLADDVALPPEDQRALLTVIDSRADQLSRLIDNLLDLTRIRSGATGTRPVPVVVADLVRRAAAPHGARVRSLVGGVEEVVTDPGLAERVLANVVENAVRHQPDGQPVLVTAETVGDRVEVRVIDTGPGVPRARRERMFEAFQREGDAPAGQGLGLGLAVARGFADAVGARLTAEDTPGGGLTMVVDLPTGRSGARRA